MSETIASIIEWSQQAFPDATLDGQREKYIEESKEWEASKCSDITELADMFIVACSVGRFDPILCMRQMTDVNLELVKADLMSKDLEDAINKKMAINRARTWEKRDGLYKHKK